MYYYDKHGSFITEILSVASAVHCNALWRMLMSLLVAATIHGALWQMLNAYEYITVVINRGNSIPLYSTYCQL